MKAYLIDPFTKSITETEHTGELPDIYRLIDCDMIAAAGLNADNDVVYVDEEALSRDLTRTAFFILTGPARAVTLAGRGLVVGIDSDGNNCEPSATIEDVKPMITWATLAELRARFH